jgi:hypothetical protein
MKIVDRLSFDDLYAKDDLIAFIGQQINNSSKGYCIVENNGMDADSFMLLLHESVGPSLSLSQKGGIFRSRKQKNFLPIKTLCITSKAG